MRSTLVLAAAILLPLNGARADEADRLQAFCHGYLKAPQFTRFFQRYGITMDDQCTCVTAKALDFETEADRQSLRQSHMPNGFRAKYKAAILGCFKELAH